MNDRPDRPDQRAKIDGGIPPRQPVAANASMSLIRGTEQAERTRQEIALSAFPETRRQILGFLKRDGAADTERLAQLTGITVSGARQHLAALERDGLVVHRVERRGAGRPRHSYALTTAGDALFPRHYGALTNELLAYVEDEDPELVARIFARRGQRRLEGALERTAGHAFPERVAIVATILDEDGYLADFTEEADGTFVITEHNCAVLSVALRYSHACSSELDFLQRTLPDAEVTRIAHRINGAHVCAYRVAPNVLTGQSHPSES